MVNSAQTLGDIPGVEVTSFSPEWISLQIAPELSSRRRVVDFFRSHLSDLDPEVCARFCMGIDELLGNALEHGCKAETKCGAQLTFVRTTRVLLVSIKDAGPGFSLEAMPHAAISNPPEDPLKHAEVRSQLGLRPGGFGIMLVRQLADDLVYNAQGNEVMLIKYL